MKRFNITGKCIPDRHYMADVSSKMTEILKMVAVGEYFIINRPRQYGKTTTLYSIEDALIATNDYIILNISFEGVDDNMFENDEMFTQGFMEILTEYATQLLPELEEWLRHKMKQTNNLKKLSQLITELTKRHSKKIVLLIDEVDQSSNNDVFIRFLAMLRNKFLARDRISTFHSVILAGVHDVKSLKMKIRPDAEQKLNSPWNIAALFNVDMNLNPHEIKPMLDEYVRDTGVLMDTEWMSFGLFRYTSGYPFLVSRLCKIMDEAILPKKSEKSWTNEDLEWAIRFLVQENNTNFESLIKQLTNNTALYDFIYAIAIDGESLSYNIHHPLVNLAVIHGMVCFRDGRLAIHNQIYNQVIVNYMTDNLHLLQLSRGTAFGGSYRNENRTLNMVGVLKGFQAFMKVEYSKKDTFFLEKQGRLIFLAFLKPIINGAGHDFKEPQISEEKRLDLVITYYEQKYVVELKIWYGQKYHEKGLIQLADYLERQGLNEGYLVIFDKNEVKNWASDTQIVNGKEIFMIWV
jgi:hypothetical protein